MNQPITHAVIAFRMPPELYHNERCVLSTRLGLPTIADMNKFDPRTANHDVATTIEGAESAVSLRLQAATSIDGTEEDLENVHAQRGNAMIAT